MCCLHVTIRCISCRAALRDRNKGWFAAFFQDDEGTGYCSIKQQDPDIASHIKNISKLNQIRTLLLSIVLTAAFVVAHDW